MLRTLAARLAHVASEARLSLDDRVRWRRRLHLSACAGTIDVPVHMIRAPHFDIPRLGI